MNVSVTGTVRQVAFRTNDDGSVASAVVKLEADGLGIFDLQLTNPALVAELAAAQPTAEMLAPAGGVDAEGKPNTRTVFSGAHPKTGTSFSAEFSI